MKKILIVFAIAVVIIGTVLTIGLLQFKNGLCDARLKELIVDNNKAVLALESLQQKQETPTQIHNLVTTSTEASYDTEFLNPDYKVIDVLTSPDKKNILIVAEKFSKEMDSYGNYKFSLACRETGAIGDCYFFVAPTKWPCEKNDNCKDETSAYLFKKIKLSDASGQNFLGQYKFKNNETVVFSTYTPGDGDSCFDEISFNVVTGKTTVLDSSCDSFPGGGN
jgi:hypothetical protein